MAVTKVAWRDIGGRDIHLLPGLVSPRLDQLLTIHLKTDAGTRTFRGDERPGSVELTFLPLFTGGPTRHGVSVDTAPATNTGAVTVDANLPSTRLRSFIILVTATHDGVPASTRIRIHVHERIVRMWLTPSLLTVRQGAKNMRFSVLARFDDGTTGDISNWAPFNSPESGDLTFVHLNGSTDPELVWSSGDDRVTVDQATGELTANFINGTAEISVVRTPLPLPGVTFAQATVRCADRWESAGANATLERHPGSRFDRMMNPDVHNVLFLPDGFADTPEDRAAFKRHVDAIVERLRTNPKTNPFKLLRESFNYFSAWVPSPEAGVSPLAELDPLDASQRRTDASTIAMPREPIGSWDIAELIHEVGLPTPDRDKPGDPLEGPGGGRLDEWQALYGLHVTKARVAAAHPQWLKLSDRVLVNERDTAFHIAVGARPEVTEGAIGHLCVLNPLRLHRDDLDKFLGSLTPNGGVWAKSGKDNDLVVVVARSNRNAGTNSPQPDGRRLLAFSLGDGNKHRIERATQDRGWDLRPDPAGTPSDSPWMTAAHELAHSFKLADEYGGVGFLSSGDDIFDRPNVQWQRELRDDRGDLAVTNITPGRPPANLLKWGWQRILKAGVLTETPAADGLPGGQFRLRLRKGHGAPFKADDVVRLRSRFLLSAVLVPLSDRLKVLRKQDRDVLIVELLPGGQFDPLAFTVDDIVMVPRVAPGGSGAELELIGKKVRDRIDVSRNPLNARHDADPNRPCDVANKQSFPTPAINFPPQGRAPKPPRLSWYIVGIYDNAAGFNCGAYRPTGICIMHSEIYDEPATGRRRVAEFCPVCRYAFIDAVDPSKHGANDRDLEKRKRFPA